MTQERRRIIISIDPGITSGYAVLVDGNVSEVGEAAYPEIIKVCRRLCNSYPNALVIIESVIAPTLSRMNRKLSSLCTALSLIFPEIRWITPGVWKTSAAAQKIPPGYSRHERDAIGLALFALENMLHD